VDRAIGFGELHFGGDVVWRDFQGCLVAGDGVGEMAMAILIFGLLD